MYRIYNYYIYYYKHGFHYENIKFFIKASKYV